MAVQGGPLPGVRGEGALAPWVAEETELAVEAVAAGGCVAAAVREAVGCWVVW